MVVIINIVPTRYTIDMGDVNRNNFNDEFMELYSEFSPSWRMEADKMNNSITY
jgi:hypothetical protein